MDCPFCSLPPERIWINVEHAMAVFDAYPVAKGHTLVIPVRHVASVYDLPKNEQEGLWDLIARVRKQLKDQLHADGFNIGVNDGLAAGQTVLHAHVHMIPRFKGDVADPRGGIRWVIPEKASYWDQPS